MKKVVLIALLGIGLSGFTENIFGQGLYKWVDEKGTIHFSDDPPPTTSNQEKEPPKEDGIEVLKRLERGSRQETSSDGKSIKIGYSQTSGGGSSSGGSTTIIRSGRT